MTKIPFIRLANAVKAAVTNTSVFNRMILGFVVALVAYPALADADLNVLIPGLGTIQADLILLETFDDDDAWEQYSNPRGVELGVENGVYRAYTMNEGFVWGLNEQSHGDVIIEVEATPLTIHYENGFGVMCRADTSNNGDGYYFMITGNSYYSIRVGEGDEVRALVEWEQSDAIRPEIDTNQLRAICVGNYLAFYANDELLAVAVDDTYETGYAGLSVAAADYSDIDVAFDNLAIYRVTE
jgi:hypothetical protein